MVELQALEGTIKPIVTRDDILTMTGIGTGTPKEVERRFISLGRYLETPVPDRVTHLWRYSDPVRFFPKSALTPSRVDNPAPAFAGEGDEVSVTLVPGTTPSIAIGPLARRQGVVVEPLHRSPAGLKLLLSTVTPEHGIFESLSGAIWSTGIFVAVPKGVRLEAPIRIVHRAELTTNAARVVIHVASGADVKIVEALGGGGDARHVLGATEVVVDEGARAEHALIQNWAPGTVGHVTCRAALGRDAVWQSATISLGGAALKADLGAVLNGVGAESNIVGVSLSRKRQHMDFHTEHHHSAARTRSRINFKTALAGRSTAVYTGLIRMEEHALSSEAFQENRNLMLSDRAKSHAIPELEIMTNEVQCSHAATSAPINEEELFYLQSRGVGRAQAERILVRGFLEDALSLIPEGVKSPVEAALDDALQALGKKGEK